MTLWFIICVVSFAILTIAVFGGLPESRTIAGPIAFITLIIGIPTFIIMEDSAKNMHNK